jgi:TonB family protein
MSEAAVSVAAGRKREFRRMVALSATLHVALSVAAVVSLPSWSDHELPAGPVISMITPEELALRLGKAAAPSRPKPPQAEPKPEPIAEPEPPPPPPEQVVIPEDTNRKPTKAKPEPQRVRDPEPRRSDPQEVEQVDLEDLLIEERILSGQMPGELPREEKPRVIPGAGGTGAPVTAEVAAWQQKVRAHVRRNWALNPGLRGKGLKALVTVELSASGLVVDYDVERSSGNPWFDESVEHFLDEVASLPAPPESGEWPIEFEGNF